MAQTRVSMTIIQSIVNTMVKYIKGKTVSKLSLTKIFYVSKVVYAVKT